MINQFIMMCFLLGSLQSQETALQPLNLTDKKSQTESQNNLEFNPFLSSEKWTGEKEGEKFIKLNTVYKLKNEEMIFKDFKEQLQKKEVFVLELRGIGQLKMALRDSKVNFDIMSTYIASRSNTNKTIVPIDEKILLSKDNPRLIFSPVSIGENFEIKISKLMDFKISMNETYQIVSNMSHELKFKVQKGKVDESKNNRIQFIVKSSLNVQKLSGNESMEMFVNKRKSFPTRKSYQMKAGGSLGYGLIKTLSPTDKYYCLKCDYYLTIYTKNVHKITLMPSIMPNGQEVNFKHDFSLIEQVEKEEVVFYVLKMPKIKGFWTFHIQPTENITHFFIHPDTQPEKLEDYLYKGKALGPSQLMITREESEEMKFSYEKFYLAFKSLDGKSTTFNFFAKKNKLNSKTFLKDNQIQEGVAVEGEVIQYYLDLTTPEPQQYSLNLQLASKNGSNQIFMKQCPSNGLCEYSQQELQQKIQNSKLEKFERKIGSQEVFLKEGVISKSKMIYNLNCIGGGMVFQEDMMSPYPQVKNCRFVIAFAFKIENPKKQGIPYKFKISGNDILNKISLNQSTNLQIDQNRTKYFMITLNEFDFGKNLTVKIILLTGDAEIYFSNFQEKPNKEDFDEMVEIKKEKNVAIRSVQKTIKMKLNDNNKLGLYMAIKANKYTVLDVYVLDSKGDNEDEFLLENKLLKREILKVDNKRIGNEVVYFRNFRYRVSLFDVESDFLEINIDSEIRGIVIGIQLKNTFYDLNGESDYSSQTEQIRLPIKEMNLKEGDHISVSVQKRLKPIDIFDNFPIRFSIHLLNDNRSTRIKLHEPGVIHSRILHGNSTVTYSMDLKQMNRRMVLIFEPDHLLQGYIHYHRSGEVIATMDINNFGFLLENAQEFKQGFCKNECYVHLQVVNQNDNPINFTLFYVIDDSPIYLKEGQEILVPAPLSMYFIFQGDKNSPIVFNYESDITQSVAYGYLKEKSQIVEGNLYSQLDEFKYDYKTNVSNQQELMIPLAEVIKMKNPLGIFYLVPKIDFDQDNSKIMHQVLYDKTGMMRVVAHSGVQNLKAFQEIMKFIKKGNTQNFLVQTTNSSNLTLFLSISSGQAKMLVKQGFDVIPTINDHDTQCSTHKACQIVLEDFKEQFVTITILALEDTHYTVLFKPNFHNLISLKYQKMNELQVKKNEIYYLDYLNTSKKFDSLLFTKGSDLEVSVLEFGKTIGGDFNKIINNPDNYLQKFIFKNGDPPRKNVNQTALDINNHYIIRIKPIQSDALVNFTIFNKQKPIIAFLRKKFHFALAQDDVQIFQVNFKKDYREVLVVCQLITGEIEFGLSPLPIGFKDFQKISKKSKKSQILDLDEQDNEGTELFNKLFIKVKASKESYFTFYVKPKYEYTEIEAGQAELIKIDKKEGKYLFFNTANFSKNIKKIQFDIYGRDFNTFKFKTLFSPQTALIHSNDRYEEMKILKQSKEEVMFIKHWTIVPEIKEGSYIFQFDKNWYQQVLKIIVTINDQKHLELNDYVKENNPSKSNNYNMFLPHSGEFRIVFSKCQGAKVGDFLLSDHETMSRLPMDQNFYQGFPFIRHNEKDQKYQFSNLSLPIRRGVVERPATLFFQVTTQKKKPFEFLTEFKPSQKQLHFKDYVQLWTGKQRYKKKRFSYKMNGGNLELKFRSITMKKQLEVDYPNVRKVREDFKVYLFGGEQFKKFKRCGLSMLENLSYVEFSTLIMLKQEYIFKNDIWRKLSISKEKLKSLKYHSTINILIRATITFYEDDEESAILSLDQRMADIPYIYATIRNPIGMGYLMYLFIIFSLVVVIYAVFKYLKKNNGEAKVYQRASQRQSGIEMA